MPLDIAKGMSCMLASTVFFAVMNGAVKILNDSGFSSMETVFFRSVSMLLVIFIFCFFIKKESLKAKQKGGFNKLMTRSLCGAFSVALVFYNLATIPLGVTVTFIQMIPIYSIVFALFTKNKPTIYMIFSALVGFGGVLMIARPDSGIPLLNICAGMLAGISATFAFITINSLKNYYESNTIVFYYAMCLTFMGLFGMIFFDSVLPLKGVGGFIMPALRDVALIIFIGIFSSLAQNLMTKAYMFAKAHIISPLGYMRIVWSIFIGVALGDSYPNVYTFIGITLIILSGLLISMPVIFRKEDFNS